MTLGTTKVPQNLDFCGGELKNFKLQNLTAAPENFVESMPYYDTVNHVPKYHNGTSLVEFGRIYSSGTGINISASNEISIADTVALNANVVHLTGEENISGAKTFRSTVYTNGYLYTNGVQTRNGTGLVLWETANPTSNKSWSISANNYSDGINIAYDQHSSSAVRTDYPNIYVQGELLYNGYTGKIDDARLNSNILRSTDKGAVNGVASLGSDGKVPSSQLPAFVDDVIDLLTVASSAPATCATGDKYYNSTSSKIFTATGTNTWGTTGVTPVSDVIYVATDTNATYRWSGSTMVNISNPIGQATESTAGIAEIATNSEVTTGTDDTRIVTPLKLAGALSNYQKALTFSTGLTNSGNTISVTDYSSLLKNTATGTNALTLLGTACSVPNGINIGYGSSADRECVSIGTNATTNNLGVAIGYGTEASYSYSTAFGTASKSTANGAIQIGYGTNSNAKTLSIGFYNNATTHYNWTLLDGTTGLIPDARISSSIKKLKYAADNPALTASGGAASWEITHGLGTDDVHLVVKEISTGEIIFPAWSISSGKVTVTFLASANISAGTYRAIIMG
ncbi:hypothetical protein IKP85_06710 [bacterium]|nr:hypothetical protein [bacterium]